MGFIALVRRKVVARKAQFCKERRNPGRERFGKFAAGREDFSVNLSRAVGEAEVEDEGI